MEHDRSGLDFIDWISVFVTVFMVYNDYAANQSLGVAVPCVFIVGLQYVIRRSTWFSELLNRVDNPKATVVKELLLPMAQDDNRTFELEIHKPLEVSIVPAQTGDTIPIATVSSKKTIDHAYNLTHSMKKLPSYIPASQVPKAPSKLAVPIGYEAETKTWLWGDFGNDLETKILHTLVAGYTGCGKDALLRLWFKTLTQNNTPEEIQFIIVDGKVDWLNIALRHSAHMFIPPAGGMDIEIKESGKIVDNAIDTMNKSFVRIFEELERRNAEFEKHNAHNLETYYKKTGIKLPYLFFIASDVGGNFNDNFKMLVDLLTMRGRAYGVRMIISLQNPVGDGTKWRSQLGLTMSGHQPNSDHDRYVFSMNVNNLKYRPSMLPNPEENNNARGVFIVKRGSTQSLVKVPHLDENDWYDYIENHLPMKEKKSDSEILLESYLTQPLAVVEEQPKKEYKLTEIQLAAIVRKIKEGKNKSEIMREMGFTNSTVYQAYSPRVDLLIHKVRNHV
jgi:hypothetical protein